MLSLTVSVIFFCCFLGIIFGIMAACIFVEIISKTFNFILDLVDDIKFDLTRKK